ncbi:hypothetical protein O181_132775 [Austropuccinia psidii MF-1]|uniref:Integrase catalytic domain-containing protein n=1 Tax=Austropuccinia psidii MF-1 TaxID=1389203 RepID=A0A9Q3QD45_9BASI|nr:hypothetical protein [Austropuccinia psidii MF-1]
MDVARDDFSGWPETVGLVKLTEKSVAEWFTLELICSYGSPKEVTVDGGPEFGKELKDEVKKSGLSIRVTTPYYPESQGMVERGHKQLKDALFKMWTTFFSPYELQFGQLPVLPIEIETKTFLAVEWHKISTTEQLLEARAKQMEGKEQMRRKAAEELKSSRDDSMKYWDRIMAHQLRSPLNQGDLVLAHKKTIETNWGLLLKKWNGPYRVMRQKIIGHMNLRSWMEPNYQEDFLPLKSKGFTQEES